jgi:hypothetical protein
MPLVHHLLLTLLYTLSVHSLLRLGTIMRRINLLLGVPIHSIRHVLHLVNNLINTLRRITCMALLHQEPAVLRVAIRALRKSIKRGRPFPACSLFFDMLLIYSRYVIIALNIKVRNGHVVLFHHTPILLFSRSLALPSDIYRRFSCSTLVVILF